MSPDTLYQPPGSNLAVIDWVTAAFHWVVGLYPGAVVVLKDIIAFFTVISFPLSLAFFIGIIYCVEGLKKIRKREAEIHELKVEPAFDAVETGDTALAHRWDKAKTLIESANPNDWKQAIMEADIILDDLLTRMGYRGDSIGEKLKRVAAGDMKSLNEAWEAHKVRNQIAHEGLTFNLQQHDAKNALNMYRKVFEEFYYI